MKNAHIIILLSLWVFSCKKEVINEVSLAPTISIKSLSSNKLKQFKDSLTIVISYQDQDGDLGFENADILSLEIKDQRLNLPDYYYVPPLAPLGSIIKIKGDLLVQLKNLFLLGSGSQETTKLTLRIRDRAGNWSNTVTSDNIVIEK